VHFTSTVRESIRTHRRNLSCRQVSWSYIRCITDSRCGTASYECDCARYLTAEGGLSWLRSIMFFCQY